MMRILTIDNKKDQKFLKTKVSHINIHSLNKKEFRELVKEMRNMMRKADGVGLSANQLGLDLRLFIAEVPTGNGGRNKFYAILNPEIIKESKETVNMEEGCLSIPETFGTVERPDKITLSGFDLSGKPLKIKAWGFLARVFQHEVDHLNGHLFIEKAKDTKKLESKR